MVSRRFILRFWFILLLGFNFIGITAYASSSTDKVKSASTSQAVEKELTADQAQVKKSLTAITTNQTSPLQNKLNQQNKNADNPFGILLFNPNYIMPYYYTTDPDQAVYSGHTPDNQTIDKSEFKAQISLLFPIVRHLFSPKVSFNIAYTQLFYWQFYAESQYFRETDYMPQAFIRYNFLKNWLVDFGAVHESNGKGGTLERSWNRVYANLSFSGPHWYVSVKPWVLIFKADSSDLHNPNIARYLGYERVVFAYKFRGIVTSLMARNTVESGFQRSAEQLSVSFPVYQRFRGYVQFFNGYGQSLIEYNHRTSGIGLGLSFNDFI